MNTIVFLATWIYGVIIVVSVGFLTYVSLEAWKNRPRGRFPWFCLSVFALLVASVTMGAFMVTTSTHVVNALMYTAGFHLLLDAIVARELKRLKSRCCSIEE